MTQFDDPSADTDAQDSGWRPLRIVRIEHESSVIRSFHLEPVDGGALAVADAGQHLPIRLSIAGEVAPVLRTYTLSNAPNDRAYRISVRRLGLASSHLHAIMRVGDILYAKPPAGSFVVDTAARHRAVMVAAGVGITPLLAMLAHLVAGEEAGQAMRPVTFFYAAHSVEERAFDAELAELQARAGDKLTLIRLLSQTGGAELGRDYEEGGFMQAAVFHRHLGFERKDFYMCGPPPFMQAVYSTLREAGVADRHIHAEAFGPASLVRTGDTPECTGPAKFPSSASERVRFAPSDVDAVWNPGDGSLLELAEAAGLTPDYGCRVGACGACKSRLVSGEVAYIRQTSAAHGENEVLICSAVPAERGGGGAPVVIALDQPG